MPDLKLKLKKYGGNEVRKLFLLFFMFITLIGCEKIKNPFIKPVIIPTTEARGPGGPAYLAGNIRHGSVDGEPVTNTHLFVMNERDYSDTLVHVFITSTDGSFRITDLPVDTVDLIFTHKDYLCTKIGLFVLKPSGNSFFPTVVDSTLIMYARADSMGIRPDKPYWAGYGPGVGVIFKTGEQRSFYVPISLVYEKLLYFNWRRDVRGAYPMFPL